MFEKDKKYLRINTKTQEFISVSKRGENEKEENFVINTINHPTNEDLKIEGKNIIDEFYKKDNENKIEEKLKAEIINVYMIHI